MELVATPRPPALRRRRRAAHGAVAVVLAALTAAVLVPLALGLHHRVVRDPAMGSSWYGAVSVVEVKPGRDLGPGNVIVFTPPGGDHEVTRRVVSVQGGTATTRADGHSTDPWQLRLDESSYARVVVRAPYVGRAVLGRGPWVALALILGLAGLVGLLVRQSGLGEARPSGS